jgi:hypothetical protein
MSTELVTKVRQFVCGLQGHDNLLEFGRGRLSLKCVSCGHETPGWDIKGRVDTAGPALTATAERRRRLLPHFAPRRA